MTTHTVSPIEATVEKHIDTTSKLVRKVDFALALLIVVSLVLGGLFLAILADHWLLKEGLSMPLRFGIFAALLAVAGLLVYRKIVPIFLYPINPVYTADLIEKDVTTFKNSLINWLLLRQEREERADLPSDKINDRMFDGIVRTAAAKVQTVPVGHAVDYQKLLWGATVFSVLLITFVAYTIFSPKSSTASIGRVLFPFSDIERPQAAQFRNVNPGDTTALQGETLTISAEVITRSPEPVYLIFSTDDGQAVNQRIPMSIPEGKIAFETPFPPGKQGSERGFNSSVDYWIAQGESRSKQYRIDVLPAASIEIVSLQYDFPAYTGLPQEITEGGDIRALEGTAVTVTVRSTLPLQDIALVFDENPSSRVSMKIEGQQTEAKGVFALKAPFPHKTFSFRATDTNGNESRRSGIYRIEVISDQSPRVQWADTAAHLREVAQINLPLNETLPFPIQAEDPDFALRYLRFKAEVPGKRIPDVSLLESPATGPTDHRGQITKTVNFSPAEKRLAVGDSVEIWAEATDTKLPEANVSETRRIRVNVIAPKAKEENPEQDETGDGGDPQQDDGAEKGADTTDERGPDQKGPEGEQGGNPDEQDSTEGNGEQPDQKTPEDGQDTNPDGTPEGEGAGQKQPDDPNSGNPNEDDSNNGNAGREPSDGGEQNTEEQRNGGQGNDPSDQQAGEPQDTDENAPGGGDPADQQSGDPQEGTGDPQGGNGGEEQGADSSPNPDTQPGEAMERIIEEMKKQGKFDENKLNQQANEKGGQDAACPSCGAPNQHGDNCEACGEQMGSGNREQTDNLDPNSSAVKAGAGSEPTDPLPSSNQSPDGQPSGQPDNQNGKEGGDQNGREGESEGNSKGGESGGEPGEGAGSGQPDSNQSGTEPGSQSGTPQEGGDQPGSGGKEGTQPGSPDGTQPDAEGTSPGQPQQGGQQDTEPGDSAGAQSGNTGGGQGTSTQTAADDPNLEYAKQVTDLVLEYLEDQLKDGPSDDLLKKLGWTEEQLRQFYETWKKMSEQSKLPQQQEEGKDFWTEAFKSIGLRPNRNRTALQGSQKVLEERRITEARRIEVPAALQERFKGFTENIGK